MGFIGKDCRRYRELEEGNEIEPYANGIAPLAFYKGGKYESFIFDSGNFTLDRLLLLFTSALP